MQVIPLSDIPTQTQKVTLAGQDCTINVYVKSTGLFCDLLVDDVQIIGGVICQDRNRIVRDLYLGFVGDLGFVDTQGKSDPTSPGLGFRYAMVYLETADLGAFG